MWHVKWSCFVSRWGFGVEVWFDTPTTGWAHFSLGPIGLTIYHNMPARRK